MDTFSASGSEHTWSDICFCQCRYEVLQFCWLSPDKRATAEEVHRFLIYLRMQGQRDNEEDFDQRWDALKPNPSTRQTTVSHSSFPILEQFADDAMRQEIDEVLTVTETSKGLSFEYVWEAAKHDHYDGNHGCSGMDTTLNYHSMFFPVPSEDIQARFPDPAARAAGAERDKTPSGRPGILPVFDAQTPSNGNEYYIQLEEQGGGSVEESQQNFVVLQDVHLDESSTDADFFHQSIDSKDSYLPDSHIWSSLENDSPYHGNIFTEEGSKQDSPSWRHSFMDVPGRSGNPFREGTYSEGQEADAHRSSGDCFLGDRSGAAHPTASWEGEHTDGEGLLSTERLADNFLFLKEQKLMRNFLSPGLVHEPEESFRMSSWDDLDSLVDPAHTPSSTSPSQRPLDTWSTSVGESLGPVVDSETLVPSITVVTEDNVSTQLPVSNGSSTEDLGPPQPSERGTDSGFDSTSERFEVAVGQTDGHTPALSQSAATDFLCTDAKLPSLEDDLGTSRENMQACSTDKGHSDDLTSNDLLSELIEDADLEMETTLSDHEESFTDTDAQPLVRASLLVSGPSLDQISQDSLLEDSMSTNLATVDHSAETPDSFDSLDIHRLADQSEELHVHVAQQLQPPYKVADSGYETENLESPEWNSQPTDKDLSPVKNGSTCAKEEEAEELAAATHLVPPEIVISEAEAALDSHSEGSNDDQQPDAPVPADEPLMGSNYRDSAYFSDNESEPEKKSEETTTVGSLEAPWLRSSVEVGGAVAASQPEVHVHAPQSSSLQKEPSGAADSEESPDPPEALSGFTEKSETQAAELVNTCRQEETPEVLTDQSETSSPPPPSDFPVHAKLTRTYAGEGHKIKEPDMEGRYLGRRDIDGHEDGVDADEEDENSDDSDDDIRTYQLHSSSSDSEDEAVHVVPVIVSDDSSARNLKSLLKPTSLNVDASSPPFPARCNADNSRRAVSFFDDVTVYLFDQVTYPLLSIYIAHLFLWPVITTGRFVIQETPTKELGDHSSGSNNQVPDFSSPLPSASFLNRFTNSESSTDEEGNTGPPSCSL